MANVILTPVTLWKDFDDTLPLDEEIVSEYQSGDVFHRELYFYGRETGEGRVKIFAHYVIPAGAEEFPAVMVLFEAGFSADMKFVQRLVDLGYAVLYVDYCGDDGSDRHTIYPSNIDYANYARTDGHMDSAEPSAKETSWYEWAAVARYGARYLAAQENVTKAGAVGIRTGGEILWKIAPYAPLACMVSVCAAGWLAYRGISKFGEENNRTFDAERHRFIAGIDSQSYAPSVKCPVLILSALNDKKYNYDRVYDTFQQINPEVERAILFSAHGNGLIGSHSVHNLELFLGKYLKERSVFISKPVTVTPYEDEAGNLYAKGVFDEDGVIEECGVFYTEHIENGKTRDWTRVLGTADSVEGNVGLFPISVCNESKKALVYAFVRYSNGFSMTSKIQEFPIKKQYTNAAFRSRVIYSTKDGLNGFSAYRRFARSIADCFLEPEADVALKPGYGGIAGITCTSGLITYRVGGARYEPPENAVLALDAYCPHDLEVEAVVFPDDEETHGFVCKFSVAGGGKWKKTLLEAADFKSESGAPLEEFRGISSILFLGKDLLLNNLIWL